MTTTILAAIDAELLECILRWPEYEPAVRAALGERAWRELMVAAGREVARG